MSTRVVEEVGSVAIGATAHDSQFEAIRLARTYPTRAIANIVRGGN